MNPRRELLAMLYAEVLSRGNLLDHESAFRDNAECGHRSPESVRMADANPVARPAAGPVERPPCSPAGPANSSVEHNDKQGPAQLDTPRRRTLLKVHTANEGLVAVRIKNGRK